MCEAATELDTGDMPEERRAALQQFDSACSFRLWWMCFTSPTEDGKGKNNLLQCNNRLSY